MAIIDCDGVRADNPEAPDLPICCAGCHAMEDLGGSLWVRDYDGDDTWVCCNIHQWIIDNEVGI